MEFIEQYENLAKAILAEVIKDLLYKGTYTEPMDIVLAESFHKTTLGKCILDHFEINPVSFYIKVMDFKQKLRERNLDLNYYASKQVLIDDGLLVEVFMGDTSGRMFA